MLLGTLDADQLTYNNDVGIYPIVIKISTQVTTPNWRRPRSIIYCTILSLTLDNSNCNPQILKQTVTYDGLTFLLQEIYGLSKLKESDNVSLSTSGSHSSLNLDPGEECIVCMSAARDTLILPCRHFSVCSTCAESLKSQARKCPICRQSFEALLKTNAFYRTDQAPPTPENNENNSLAQQGYYPISLFKSIYSDLSTPTHRPPHLIATNSLGLSDQSQLSVAPYPVSIFVNVNANQDGGLITAV